MQIQAMETGLPGAGEARRPRSNRGLWVAMAVPAILSGLWALLVASRPEAMPDGGYARMFAIPAIGYAHVLGGAVASILGPFQFLALVRRRWPKMHVWLGRFYLVAVAAGGLAGLYLSPGSLAANTFGIAFVLLAVAWLWTGWMAYSTIRHREISAHRRWMIRNFSLTYAAVTLRVQMPLLVVLGVEPIMALNIVGWTCWIPNLLLVEWWMRRRDGSQFSRQSRALA